LREWDQAAGFRPGDVVSGLRRAEDREALALLRAEPLWLDFCDSQYGCSPSVAEVTTALQEIVKRANPHAVLLPLGLFHSDHHLAHEATRVLLWRDPTRAWFVYADALYRCFPGLVTEKLRACALAGLRTEPVAPPASGDDERKRRAVHCYRSQLRALTTPGRPGYGDAFAPETFWRLRPE
jgi:LmbE family N-acetylglucosaminyl deacetylase